MSSRIDWQAARERLARAGASLEKAARPEPEFIQEVFRKRAERLARRQELPGHHESEIRALLFLVGDEKYAIDIGRIAEIVTNPLWTPVPGAPPSLLGVIQVHGEICPLWSLARLIGVGETAPGAALVLRVSGSVAAVAVTAVREIGAFRRDDFAPSGGKSPMVKGIGPGLVAWLDAEEIMKEAVR
jgi:purine-binding chemotaxis protein CheW